MPDEVGEEHGHEPPLGDRRPRGCRLLRTRRLRGERGAALAAELLPSGQLGSARRAGGGERRAALDAEALVRRVLGSAARAGHAITSARGRRDGIEPLEPGRRLEPREDLARLREQRLRLGRASVGGEPLGVLELRHREPEGEVVLAEAACGSLEAGLLVRHARAEALRLRLEEGRTDARRELLDHGEKLVGPAELAEGERGFDRPHEALLHALIARTLHRCRLDRGQPGSSAVGWPPSAVLERGAAAAWIELILDVDRPLEMAEEGESALARPRRGRGGGTPRRAPVRTLAS